MHAWHVWGDYVHTMPDRIGEAVLERGTDAAAKRSADAAGFEFDRRLRNGFEPWAATFSCENGDVSEVEFAFASYPVVRGWRRL